MEGSLAFDTGKSLENSRPLALSFFVTPQEVMKSGITRRLADTQQFLIIPVICSKAPCERF